MRNVFAACGDCGLYRLVGRSMDVPGKDVVLTAAYVALKSQCTFFCIHVAVTEVGMNFAKGTGTARTITEAGFWTYC